MKRRRRSYGPVIMLFVVALFLIFVLIYRQHGNVDTSSHINLPSENPTDTNIKNIEFEVSSYNTSALIIKMKNKNLQKSFFFNSDYSNSNRYIEILSQKINFDKADDYPFYEHRRKDIPGDYMVTFPILWAIKKTPYANLSANFGVAESLFLFPKYGEPANYFLDFSNLNLSVFNSFKGSGRKFKIKSENLFDSYFIFGDFKMRCSYPYKNFSLNIISAPDFPWNDSYCLYISKIFDYYYKTFGKPIKLKSNYTILFSSEVGFNAMSSGMVMDKFQIDTISHEMFHGWQPKSGECMQNLFYSEGLTTYMQYYSLFATGIQKKDFFESVFSTAYSNLLWVSQKINKTGHLSYSELEDIRKKNPGFQYFLLYEKGALIWKKIADSGVSVNDLFSASIKGQNCTQIINLMQKYEKELDSDVQKSLENQ